MTGLSLIELMISITIGMIILTAVALVFVNASNSRKEIERNSRQIENGRYAIDLLADDVRLTGFYGELNVGQLTAPTTLPNPCSTAAADWNSAIPVHIQGYNAGSGAPTSCLPSTLNFQPNTDILVVRRARACVAGVGGCDTPSAAGPVAAPTTGYPYLQVSLCADETTTHVLGLQGTADFTTLHKTDCTTAASLRQYYVNIYFVSTDNGAGVSIPTLKRLEFNGASFTVTPLVEGIEHFNVEYGMDTTGPGGIADGSPDAYVADPEAGCATEACKVANWMSIVTAKIYVIARNLEPSSGYTDSKTYSLGSLSYTPTDLTYRRHAYSALVRIVNPSSRRDTP